jgi:putative pyruvate formate lyase activating enzyme
VASFCAHHGEEPALSGSRGSGTVFFGNCNLRCLYCQNYQISQNWQRQKLNEIDCHTLAQHMLYLQDELGCHNINFVSPSHFVPQIVRAVLLAVPMGLKIPLVYNTNSYDSVKTLRELDGIINIYLPDLKYASDTWAKRLSQAPDYVRYARSALKEMFRQVGELVVDESGVAQRGVIVRHLILPNGLAGSKDSLTWLAHEVSPRVTLSLMSQYHPIHRAHRFEPLSRTISLSEYEAVLKIMNDVGLENGWRQGMGADKIYLPDFESNGHPFALKNQS